MRIYFVYSTEFPDVVMSIAFESYVRARQSAKDLSEGDSKPWAVKSVYVMKESD